MLPLSLYLLTWVLPRLLSYPPESILGGTYPFTETSGYIGLIPLIQRVLPRAELVYAKECSAGHTITDPNVHSDGEFSIEAVVRKAAR